MAKTQTSRDGKAEVLVLVLAISAIALVGFLLFGSGKGATGPIDASTAASTNDQTRTQSELSATIEAIESAKRESAWDKAEALTRSAIEKDAGQQSLYIQLAEVLVAKQQAQGAFDAYQKALAIGPRSPELEFVAGSAASEAGRHDRAEELYLGVLAERPSDWRHPLYLAQVQVKLGKLAEAKKHLLMTVNLKDDVAIAWGTLGEVALRENQLELALQHIARARALDPRDMLWRLVEARALKRKGKPEEALQVLSGASDNDLLQQGVVTTMVECYGLLQRPLDAAKLYAKLSDLLGDRGDFALEAARWFTRAGDNASARKYAQHAQYLGVAEAKELLSATP